MYSELFNLKLSKQVKEQIIEVAGGKHLRIPKTFSKNNQFYKTFFNLPLHDHIKAQIIEAAGGKRIRIPTILSKHNLLYTEKRNKLICIGCSAGLNLSELSQQFKLTTRRIRKILKENNIQYSEKKKKSFKEEIKLLLKLGYKKAEIARRVGKTRAWVYQIMKEEGLNDRLCNRNYGSGLSHYHRNTYTGITKIF